MVSSEHPLGKADNSKIVVQRNIFANPPISPFMSSPFTQLFIFDSSVSDFNHPDILQFPT